ncbi:MAG: WD40 repeat domain-containing protein [Myxococcota bacterium]
MAEPPSHWARPGPALPAEPPRVLAATHDAVAVGLGGGVWVFDVATGAVRWARSGRSVADLAFSVDGARLFTLSSGEVHAWDAHDGTWRAGHEDGWHSGERLALSADGRLLLAAFDDGPRLLDADTLQQRQRWPLPRLRDADLHPSGAWVVWVQGDYGETEVVAVRVGDDAPTVLRAGERARFTAEGDRLVVDHRDGAEVVAWPVPGPQRGFGWPSFERARFWPGGALLVRGNETTVLSPDAPEPRWEAANYEGPADVAVVAAADLYYTAHPTWIGRRRLADGVLVDVLPLPIGASVLSAHLVGDRLAVGDVDGRVAVWDLSGPPQRIALADPGPTQVDEAMPRASLRRVVGVRLDGPRVWAVGDGGAVCWHGAPEGPPDTTFEVHEPQLTAGDRVVGRRDDAHVVLALPGGDEVGRVATPEGWGWRQPVADPAGAVLYGGEADDVSAFSAWDTASGAEIAVLEVDGHAELLRADAVGAWLSVATDDGRTFVARWDPRRGAVEALVPPSDDEVQGPAPGGGFVVDGEAGLEVRDHDGVVVLTLPRGHQVLAWDGDRCVAADRVGTVAVWSAATGQRLAACGSGPWGSWWAEDAAGSRRWVRGPMAWRAQ